MAVLGFIDCGAITPMSEGVRCVGKVSRNIGTLRDRFEWRPNDTVSAPDPWYGVTLTASVILDDDLSLFLQNQHFRFCRNQHFR